MARTPTASNPVAKYNTVALLLQGGGALGSYQAGVYEGLLAAGITPNWLAGISIGAMNTAILAGNPVETRVEKLREFWDTICHSAITPMLPLEMPTTLPFTNIPYSDAMRSLASSWAAWRTMTEGQQGFFTPRWLAPWMDAFGANNKKSTTSFYDTAPMKDTLERLVDFDRINSGETRVSVGAVNVETGNFVYFDNTKIKLRAEHFMASGALPPGFPAIEIDGQFYWDGGLVSNTPLSYVLDEEDGLAINNKNILAIQVDLWSARGPLPKNLPDTVERQKDIQFSSRTRMVTDAYARRQKGHQAMAALINKLPAATRKALANDPDFLTAQSLATTCNTNILHLIYQDKAHESMSKDAEFSRATMEEHWQSGLTDIRKTVAHKDWLDVPTAQQAGFVTHDAHRVPK